MEVTGKTTIYVNGFKGQKGEDRISISAKVTSKIIGKKGDEYVTGFMPVQLSNDVKRQLGIENYDSKTREHYDVELENAWIGVYEMKNENKVFYLFINECSIIDEEKEKKQYKKQSYRK